MLCLYRGYHSRTKSGNDYIPLIQFLLDNGVDPKVISIDNSTSWDKLEHHSGTALDIFAPHMVDLNFRTSATEEIQEITIYKKLVDNGCEFSQPFSTIVQKHPCFNFNQFQEEVLKFHRFPEHIERK